MDKPLIANCCHMPYNSAQLFLTLVSEISIMLENVSDLQNHLYVYSSMSLI